MTLPPILFDAHTHVLSRNALVDIDPVGVCCGSVASRPLLRPGFLYSVGIHPWNAASVSAADLRLLRVLAAEPQVRAIGECGLDPLRLNSGEIADRHSVISLQTDLLRVHFELSQQFHKPLLLHIVRTFPEIIALRRQWRPSQPWIIHGFRGKPQLARELLANGFHLSFGLKYNPESYTLTPPGRRLRETDSMSSPE